MSLYLHNSLNIFIKMYKRYKKKDTIFIHIPMGAVAISSLKKQ